MRSRLNEGLIAIAKADWNTIRAEYIAGGISQRKLAKKHGVSINTLAKKANRERWATDRDNAYRKSAEKAQQKTADSIANNAIIAMRIRQKLLERLEKEISTLPDKIGTTYSENDSDIEYGAGKGSRPTKQRDKRIEYRLRDLASAWKDLTEGLAIVEESPNTGESGFTEALKGIASEAWSEDETE